MASQITSLTIVYPTVYSSADKKPQSSASLAFVRGIHRWPVNSPHKGPVTRKMFHLMTSSCIQGKPRVAMQPTLSPMVAPRILIYKNGKIVGLTALAVTWDVEA